MRRIAPALSLVGFCHLRSLHAAVVATHSAHTYAPAARVGESPHARNTVIDHCRAH